MSGSGRVSRRPACLRCAIVYRTMNMGDRREGQRIKGGGEEGQLCHPGGGWQSLAISVFLS